MFQHGSSKEKGDTYSLKSRENRQRESGDLNRTSDDIRYHEHEHAQLQTSEPIHPR